MFTTMTMPRWIGSMPSFMAMGKKIGARISTIAEGSMKLPATSSTTLTISRKPIGVRPSCTTHSVICWGICSVVNTWAESMALAMMNISMMLSRPDSSSTLGQSRRRMSLYTNSATKAEYTAATAAASVGVNSPE